MEKQIKDTTWKEVQDAVTETEESIYLGFSCIGRLSITIGELCEGKQTAAHASAQEVRATCLREIQALRAVLEKRTRPLLNEIHAMDPSKLLSEEDIFIHGKVTGHLSVASLKTVEILTTLSTTLEGL